MNCLNCNKESKTKYCNGTCRKAYYRANKAKVDEQPKINLVESPTINEVGQVGQIQTGTKHGAYLDKPLNLGRSDCQCRHCLSLITNKITAHLNHGAYMEADDLGKADYDFNRVSLPGDIDYIASTEPQVKEDMSQRAIHTRNEQIQSRLRSTSIEQLIKQDTFIPVWRYTMNGLNIC